MIPVLKDRRARIALIILFILALILTLPMRLAFGLLGLDKTGIAARDMSGSIWAGRIESLKVANVDVGTVAAGLSPLQLVVGRARLDVRRRMGLPDDLTGAIGMTANSFGVDDATTILPLGGLLAPMPVRAVDMKDVTVRFDHGRCVNAEGRVKMQVDAVIPGLPLAQGLSGDAVCSAGELLLPLAGQSGMELLTIHVTADGRYRANFTVRAPDPAAAATLIAAGFSANGEKYSMTLTGSL